MSAVPVEDSTAVPATSAQGWALRLTQLVALARLEWRRLLSPARGLLLLVLALLPVVLMLVASWGAEKVAGEHLRGVAGLREEFANFYHGVVVRLVLFFGCVALFLNLVRGELEAKTLHYSLLTPLPRPLLVLGKYASTLVLAWGVFLVSTVGSIVALHLPWGLAGLGSGQATGDLAAYSAMTVLGCLAYGALFLALGTLTKSPGYVVALYYAWEWFQFLLPPLLKQLSVVHYLRQLTPVPIGEGPFAILAEPQPAWLTVGKLLLYAAVALAIAVWRLRDAELDYGGD